MTPTWITFLDFNSMRKKARERPKEQIGDLEEVAGPDLRGVVAQKRAPLLPSWRLCASSSHVFLDGALAYTQAQFQHPRVDCPWPSA